MKKQITVLLIALTSIVWAKNDPAPAEDFYSRASVANTIAVLDDLITRGETLFDAPGGDAHSSKENQVEAHTQNRVYLTFSASKAGDDILYLMAISRLHEGLDYSEAASVSALFADRAGLPHLGQLKEDVPHVYQAFWLIKASHWPEARKSLLATRESNRKETDPLKILEIALAKEKIARTEAEKKEPKL
jgi:hypothetical protein